MAVSNSERKKIIEAKQRGEKTRDIVKWYKVSRSTVWLLCKQQKEKGTCEPTYKGRISLVFTEDVNIKIKEEISKDSDITLEELIEKLKLNISVSGLWRHLQKLKISFKKNT